MSVQTANVVIVWIGHAQLISLRGVFWPFLISLMVTAILVFLTGYQPVGANDRGKCAFGLISVFSIYSVWVLPILLAVLSHAFDINDTAKEPLGLWVGGILISGSVGVIGLIFVGSLGCWVSRLKKR